MAAAFRRWRTNQVTAWTWGAGDYPGFDARDLGCGVVVERSHVVVVRVGDGAISAPHAPDGRGAVLGDGQRLPVRDRQGVPVDHHVRTGRVVVGAMFDEVGEGTDLRTGQHSLVVFAGEKPVGGTLLCCAGEYAAAAATDSSAGAQHAGGEMHVGDPALLG